MGERRPAGPRPKAADVAARAKAAAAVALGLTVPTDPTRLLGLVRQGSGLTEEATWQALAEFVAEQYGTGTEPLATVVKQLTECAKMQLLIRSLRRKEGGSVEAERLAAFQALMQEVYGVAEEDADG